MSIHPYYNPYTFDYDAAVVRVTVPFDGIYEAAVTLAPRAYEVKTQKVGFTNITLKPLAVRGRHRSVSSWMGDDFRQP